MTTIAANLKSMAADSMASDNFADFPVHKIRSINGSLYGGCGTLVGMAKFFDWLERGAPAKKPKHRDGEEFTVLELNKEGLFIWESAYIRFQCAREFHAVGAGAQAAIALMMHVGLEPEDAVDASCDVVPSACARPVHVFHLEDAPKKRKVKAA